MRQRMFVHLGFVVAVLVAAGVGRAQTTRPFGGAPRSYDVRAFGAVGDGKALDSPAINAAIDAAAASGGGTVYFAAGTYRSYSIRLKNNVGLYLDHGVTLLAAASPATAGRGGRGRGGAGGRGRGGARGFAATLPTTRFAQRGGDFLPATLPTTAPAGPAYDLAEPNEAAGTYQDFGHSHWHNSLIWGENLSNISITGPGMIDGVGLSRGASAASVGAGEKAIALKSCHNVTLRDITIYRAGHFGILVTGVDNLTIDNLRIDTNRDGIDIDCCRNVRVSDTSINSPNDDGLVLKSSFALGEVRDTANVTITNCQLSGYDVGTFLDGTFAKTMQSAPDGDGPTGRIKIGTETTGGFKNITISNCVFDHCRGLALETVDGSPLEDISISNITMRDIVNSPIFLRLGTRMRAPAGTAVGDLRRVNISNIVVYNADPYYASIVSGVPGHEIEDVHLSNIRIVYQGGGPKDLGKQILPEYESDYPEPSMFGNTPAYGFFIRHVKGIDLSNVRVSYMKDDYRPPFILEDVQGADFQNIQAPHAPGISTFILRKVQDFSVRGSPWIPDATKAKAEDESF